MLEFPTPEWSDYCRRLNDEHRFGWLTAAHHDVLIAIAILASAGDWEPTVARIAVAARCSPRTVQRARARAQERGLLVVREQFVLVDGWMQQRANRYELTTPTEPVRPKPQRRRGRQGGGPRESISKRREVGGVSTVRARAREALPKGSVDLLLARRLAFERGLREGRERARRV